jgi:hypothetical protein|tara:strand:- start:165 stop:479 length:315 start_codon:yes stop_codon:yes gene_type:complete
MEYEEIQQPGAWKPGKEGDTVEGVLVNRKKEVGPNKSMLYHLKQKDDNIISVWGSTVLDNRLELVPDGSYIRITFKGIEQNKIGQPVKIFKVEKAISEQTEGAA